MKTPDEFSPKLDEAYVDLHDGAALTIDVSWLSWKGWDDLVAYVAECRKELKP